jgi:hypothetical protein
MGAERWLQFERGEMKKVRTYLQGVEYITVSEENGPCVYIEFLPRRLEIGYGAGNSTMAAMVSRELAKRFHVKRIGSDSTGWYSDADWDKIPEEEYGKKYTRWADWIAEYKPSFDRMYKWESEELDAVDMQVIGWFQTRDFSEAEMERTQRVK